MWDILRGAYPPYQGVSYLIVEKAFLILSSAVKIINDAKQVCELTVADPVPREKPRRDGVIA